jgi:hypothetical protein
MLIVTACIGGLASFRENTPDVKKLLRDTKSYREPVPDVKAFSYGEIPATVKTR